MRSLLLVSAAALSLSLSAIPAHADDTYTTFNISAYGDGGSDPTEAYTANGTVTIDTTNNSIAAYFIQDSLGLTLDSSVDNPYLFSDPAANSYLADFGASDLTVVPPTPGDPNNPQQLYAFYDYLLTLYMPTAGTYAVCTVSANCNSTAGEYVSYGEPPPAYEDLVDNATLTPISDTPEPSSFVLLGTGILGLAAFGRRRFLTT